MTHLEAQVTRGRVVYIHSVERDLAYGRLVFRFLDAPKEEDPVSYVLTFSGVENFVEYFDGEPGEDYWEQLIGLHEVREDDGRTRYVFRLDQSEIHFRTRLAPILRE